MRQQSKKTQIQKERKSSIIAFPDKTKKLGTPFQEACAVRRIIINFNNFPIKKFL